MKTLHPKSAHVYQARCSLAPMRCQKLIGFSATKPPAPVRAALLQA